MLDQNSNLVGSNGNKVVDMQQYIADLESNLINAVQQSYKLGMLLQTTALLNSSLDIDEIVPKLMEATTLITETKASLLMLVDEDTGELVVKAASGEISENIVDKRIPKSAGISGWAVENDNAIIAQDVTKDDRFYALGEYVDNQATSMIFAPIKIRNKLIGALAAYNRYGGSDFAESDLRIIELIARQAAIAFNTARLHSEVLEKQRLEHELVFARKIQERFWPNEPPNVDGIDVAAVSVPATQVGGDYYDFIILPEKQIGIAIGDIAGKDVSAALLMATTRSALRVQAEENVHPLTDIFHQLNNAIYRDTVPEIFLTLFYGVLDSKDRQLRYINGAHNPPIIYNSSTQQTKLLDVGGTLVGMFPDTNYEADSVQLHSRDTLVMYTDGITEASNLKGEMFSEERLGEIIRKSNGTNAHELLGTIQYEVNNFSMGVPQQDDMTLVVVKVA